MHQSEIDLCIKNLSVLQNILFLNSFKKLREVGSHIIMGWQEGKNEGSKPSEETIFRSFLLSAFFLIFIAQNKKTRGLLPLTTTSKTKDKGQRTSGRLCYVWLQNNIKCLSINKSTLPFILPPCSQQVEFCTHFSAVHSVSHFRKGRMDDRQ